MDLMVRTEFWWIMACSPRVVNTLFGLRWYPAIFAPGADSLTFRATT